MSSERDERLLREYLATEESPRPDPAFAARLRAQFVSGEFPRQRPRAVAMPPQWWLIPLAAAALLLFWVASPQSEGPQWRLESQEGLEYVLVDGQRVSLSELEGALAPGRSLALPEPGARLELSSGDQFYLQLEGTVRMRLPESLGKRMDGDVAGSGYLRIVTGPAFAGHELFMRAPRVDWRVTGTVFTAIVHEEGLCLCVHEGTIEACMRGDAMEPVSAGHRFTLFPGTDDLERGDIMDAERTNLTALEARASGHWRD